ncbi:hypothetical protein FOF74_006425 [Lactobacillus gasseri]|uniref:hypothetical protein n=1 Tax=Lactobacillus TaxID=1578 RepID=UPI0003420E1E|nr:MULTISPECIES: hypothetical protein [Lactobacillus]KDA99150.1 hypothetical protein LK7_003725 [Lactobacillus paragasseri K7]MDK7211197.1 hypothetical protein [Lactobacillus gasseri]MDK8141270.1 hypothetical protein [Lactobacillus gasseri]MDK8391355.1 hypothetical protein [Lactobacillus gasseri]MDT9589173.1 hypothetical protein [Lactobacillus paragasseri]
MTSKHAEFEKEYMTWQYKLEKEASDWRKNIVTEALTHGSYQQGINWINNLKPKIDDNFPGGTLGAEINYLREIAEDARQDVMKQALSQNPNLAIELKKALLENAELRQKLSELSKKPKE